jgi:hypothetical protein
MPATASPSATPTSSRPARASTTTGRLVQSRSSPNRRRSASGHSLARKRRTSGVSASATRQVTPAWMRRISLSPVERRSPI